MESEAATSLEGAGLFMGRDFAIGLKNLEERVAQQVRWLDLGDFGRSVLKLIVQQNTSDP